MQGRLKLWLALCLALALTITAHACCADRVPIPTQGFIEEAEQVAVIAWNGEEEVLVLSVSLQPSRSQVEVLEVIPLPSMPTVELVEVEAFKELLSKVQWMLPLTRGAEGLDVAFHEVLGPHDLWVLEVEDAEGLASWIQDYSSSRGLPSPEVLNEAVEVFQRYIDSGYRFFAIDALTLTGEHWVEPLMYRFNSSHLYYPLEVTSLAEGYTTIALIVLSTEQLDLAQAHSLGFMDLYAGLIEVEELGLEELEEVLGSNPVHLYLLSYMGWVKELEGDLKLSFATEEAEQWLPYTPDTSQVEVDVEVEDGRALFQVCITFPTSGFHVDWGGLERDGNRFWADVSVTRWTGPVLQVITFERNTYVAEGLGPGVYTFTFKVNGESVAEETFMVWMPATFEELKAALILLVIGLVVVGLPLMRSLLAA